ncbi:MAG TPA: ATP-binding protein, partial [Magnetospirillum sp.]|nr:ATP-binding protein [Magnetospirillum sp.]
RLEGEVLGLASAANNLSPATRRAALEALGNAAASEAELERPGPEVLQHLLDMANGADVVLLHLVPKRLPGGDALVEAQARVLFADGKRAPQAFSAKGFSQDRRAAVMPVALTTALMAVVAVLAVLVILRRHSVAGQPVSHDLAVAVVAFVFGRAAPLGAFQLAGTVVPLPSATAELAANIWWPAWVGVVLFAVPVVVWRVAGPRLAAQAPVLAAAGRLGFLGLGVGLGAAAHAAMPLILYMDSAAVLPVLGTAIAAGAIGFGIGRSVDRFDTLDVLWGVPPLVLSMALGVALSATSITGVMVVAALSVVSVVLPWAWGRRTRSAHGEAQPGTAVISAHGDRWELPITASVLEQATAFRPGEVLWLGVEGESGAGKSALVARVIESWRARSAGLTLFQGSCRPLPGSETAPPFGPIQQALAGQLEMALSQGRNAVIGSAIEGAAAMLLGPMAGFLRGEGGAASEADLFVFVARKLKELALRGPVVLVIDDTQWLDASSLALLGYLRRHLGGKGGHGVAIVLAGRHMDEQADIWGQIGISPLRVDGLDAAQQQDFLAVALGLSGAAAHWVIQWLGEGAHTPGKLRDAVEHLVKHGALEPAGTGLDLAQGSTPSVPPLPGAAERVRDALAAMPDARAALAAAACIGLRFELSLVAEAVDRPLGDTIALMDEIERRTGLVRDDQGSDDIYMFASLQVLEAVRSALGAVLCGPLAADVPQIVRHLNGRLADALEARGVRTGEDRLRLALHRFGAGRTQAAQAVDACLDAALALARMFRYGDARQMVARARECAQAGGGSPAVDRVEWTVDAAECHVRGVAEDSARIARRGIALLEADDEAIHLLPQVAQACYDGVRADRALLAETTRLATRMAEGQGETAAEGLHLMALAAARQPGSDYRLVTLRRALAAAEAAGEPAAKARIANSLAEELAGGDQAAQAEARALFQLSLDLKNDADIRDLPGLARTHGGMGRLAFFGTPPDYAQARHHFEEDLRLSEQIGDLRGISKMESLLGACARAEGRLGEAEAHYRRSIAQDVDQLDVCLSFAGLLACHTAAGDGEAFDETAAEARSRDFSGVPDFARTQLSVALAAGAAA